MTWTEARKHAEKQLDSYELKLFRDLIPRKLELFHDGSALAVDHLAFPLAWMLLTRGSAFVRSELEPIKHILPQSIAAYVQDCEGTHTLSVMLFEYTSVTNIFEIVGLSVPPEVLDSFRPLILRVGTDYHDMPNRHWLKALVALALGERLGRPALARFVLTLPVPFVPRAKFEFNMDGLIAHLGGALLSGAPLDDVLPAWHQFLALAVTLSDIRQIDDQVILWVARVVFHHIGKQPLSVVGDLVFDEINRLIAAGA